MSRGQQREREVCSLLITEDLLISQHEAGVGGSQGVETPLLPQHQAEVGAHLVLPPLLHQLGLVLYQLLAQAGASLDVVSLVEADMAVVELVKMPGRGVENLRSVRMSTLSCWSGLGCGFSPWLKEASCLHR